MASRVDSTDRNFTVSKDIIMRTNALLITTLLSTSILLSITACSHKPDALTSSKVRTDTYSNDNMSSADHTARDAAEDF